MPWFVRLAAWWRGEDCAAIVWERTMQRFVQLGDTVSDERWWNEMPTYEFVNAMFTLPSEFKPEQVALCFDTAEI